MTSGEIKYLGQSDGGTNMADVFADHHHIEQIRKRLWCGREFGQASVFVGAGFSRNAHPISPNTPPFALWNHITSQMFDALYPTSLFGSVKHRNQVKLRTTSGNGVLRIAQEFELSMGRPVLEKLLHEAIPDNDFQPGPLHELLLSLPWSDVFTTNYDTLLERTRHRIYERKYDLVVTPLDLPSAMKPRIIKLHGSFPSNRPYIITEEDFRTYPSRFAPFVNTVQQAIMENSLCLLGFSGDDPNFLFWSGWVRDNLGPSAPPIYLIGLLDLSPSQRKILESRQVIPIDLSPLFPVSSWPVPDIRHQKAMEWILLTLLHGAPAVTTSWPIQRKDRTWDVSEDLPAIPAGPAPIAGPGPSSPSSPTLTLEDISQIVSTWQAIRIEYPGWLILPDSNRTTLWNNTKSWVRPILRSISVLPVRQQLEALFELTWRINVCLAPLPAGFDKATEDVLSKVNPFPSLIPSGGVEQLTPRNPDGNVVNWGQMAEWWIELAFSLIRQYRHQHDEEAFQTWMSRLQPVVRQNRDWLYHWHHEDCLFALNYETLPILQKKLMSWPPQVDMPIWEIRRAAIMAELGTRSEAETIAERALTEIRTRIRPHTDDFGPLSEEGWAMLLVDLLRPNPFRRSTHFRDRWEKLGQFKCNPWTILERAEGELLKLSQQDGFLREVPDTPYFLVRIYEQAGIPIRCGPINLYGDSVFSAAKHIWPHFPVWALGLMLRVGKDREIRDWFDETRIATMPTNDVDELFERLVGHIYETHESGVREGSGDPWVTSFSHGRFAGLCQLLSRLCFRLNSLQKSIVVDLACTLYRTPWTRTDNRLHRCVETLVQCIMPQLLPDELLAKMEQLLELPVPSDAGFDVSDPDIWPEPFRHARWETTPISPDKVQIGTWTRSIQNLIRLVESGTLEGRSRAVFRLQFLHRVGILSDQLTSALGKALWSRVDAVTGLPADTHLRRFAFLYLPCPDPETAIQTYQAFILNSDFNRSMIKSVEPDGSVITTVGFGFDDDEYQLELLHSGDRFANNSPAVTWTREEAEALFEKAARWWREEGKELASRDYPDFFRTNYERSTLLVRVLARVIFPSMRGSNKIEAATSLLYDMEVSGICVHAALPSTMFLPNQDPTDVTQRLRAGLNALEPVEVGEAVEGVYMWMTAHDLQLLPAPPSDVVKECVDIVTSRRQPGLDTAISVLTDMINSYPRAFMDHLASLYVTLEYLEAATAIPIVKGGGTAIAPGALIPLTERLNYRILVSRLAASIKRSLEPTLGHKSATIITKWQEHAETSNIASIRWPWI